MILALLLCVAPSLQAQLPAPAQAPPPAQEQAAAVNHVQRVDVLGASMSAGFGLMQEAGAAVTIADFLKLALGDSCETMHAYGDTRFFQQPAGFGQKQVQKSLHSDPSLIIAVDFPFWYGYGYLPDCESRLQQMDDCFKQLERISCPILLGDFPDMSPALLGSSALRQGKPMLDPAQIPDAECLGKLNEKLYAWAKTRSNVHIFPLSFFVAEVGKERTFEFRGIAFDREAKGLMLQSDLLHPTVKGTAAATLFILHHLVEAGWLAADQIEWDAQALERALNKSTQAARDKAAERKRKRQERKLRREAEKAKEQEEDGQRTPVQH